VITGGNKSASSLLPLAGDGLPVTCKNKENTNKCTRAAQHNTKSISNFLDLFSASSQNQQIQSSSSQAVLRLSSSSRRRGCLDDLQNKPKTTQTQGKSVSSVLQILALSSAIGSSSSRICSLPVHSSSSIWPELKSDRREGLWKLRRETVEVERVSAGAEGRLEMAEVAGQRRV
jgi:hypothetical protein